MPFDDAKQQDVADALDEIIDVAREAAEDIDSPSSAVALGYAALPDQDRRILWAALWAAVDNVHAPIDSFGLRQS